MTIPEPHHRLSCHCGAVRFEIDTDGIDSLGECNCSICHKKGALWHRVTEDRFRLISGEDALREYRFNTGIAQHLFCRHWAFMGFTIRAPRRMPIRSMCAVSMISTAI